MIVAAIQRNLTPLPNNRLHISIGIYPQTARCVELSPLNDGTR